MKPFCTFEPLKQLQIKNAKTMATQLTNIFGIQQGDVISFTNKIGASVSIKVGRVEQVSWYTENGFRNSFGTLAQYSKLKNFTITKQGA